MSWRAQYIKSLICAWANNRRKIWKIFQPSKRQMKRPYLCRIKAIEKVIKTTSIIKRNKWWRAQGWAKRLTRNDLKSEAEIWYDCHYWYAVMRKFILSARKWRLRWKIKCMNFCRHAIYQASMQPESKRKIIDLYDTRRRASYTSKRYRRVNRYIFIKEETVFRRRCTDRRRSCRGRLLADAKIGKWKPWAMGSEAKWI